MRLNEIENNDEIDKILKRYFEFTDYELLPDGSINVNGPTNFRLAPKDGKLPIKFNKARNDFSVAAGDLITLEGCPTLVSGEFSCSFNQLTSLEGGPIEVYGDYHCTGNGLKSLNGLPKVISGAITLHYFDNLPLLRLLFVKELKLIAMLGISTGALTTILNRYIGTGRKGALACAAELTKAGFKGNARL